MKEPFSPKAEDPIQDGRETLTAAHHVKEAAGLYLGRGWQPLALRPGTKVPRAAKWTERRLQPDDLAAEFSESDNVGLQCGTPSGGLVDVDIDDDIARTAFARWLPPTDMRHGRPSSMGSHWWYRADEADVRTEQFKDPTGSAMLIEIRATGGQTMVPPSVHPNGERLSWTGAFEPARISLRALRTSVLKVAVATLIARHWPGEGGRDAAALALGGALLRANMDTLAAADFVQAVAAAAGDEEAEDRAATVHSTHKKLQKGEAVTGFTKLKEILGGPVADTAFKWLREAGEIQDVMAWEPAILFDGVVVPEIRASLLPGSAGKFAKALADAAEVPEAMPVFMVLGAISVAVAGHWMVMPKEGWMEHLNIYTAIAMEPGNNKSLVVRRATRPLVDWEIAQREELQPKIVAARSKRKSEEKLVEHKRRDAVKEQNPILRTGMMDDIAALEAALTEIPVLPKLFTSDATPESLAASVAEQGGRFGIVSDEGGITETLGGLYTNGSANIDILLKGIDGGAIRVLRKDRSFDLNPILTIAMAIQPQILMNMAQRRAFSGNGLLDRFLFLIPSSRLGYRKHDGPPIPVDVETAYGDVLRALLEKARGPTSSNGAAVLSLNSDAKAAWQEFRTAIECELRPDGLLGQMTGWGAKLPGFTLRLAGLLHLMPARAGEEGIDRETIAAAIELAQKLIDHRKAAMELMGGDPATDDAKSIFAWILREGVSRFTRTECSRANRGRIKKTRQLDDALRALLDRGIVVCREQATTGKAGRPAAVYEVNPLVFDRK